MSTKKKVQELDKIVGVVHQHKKKGEICKYATEQELNDMMHIIDSMIALITDVPMTLAVMPDDITSVMRIKVDESKSKETLRKISNSAGKDRWTVIAWD